MIDTVSNMQIWRRLKSVRGKSELRYVETGKSQARLRRDYDSAHSTSRFLLCESIRLRDARNFIDMVYM
jgi:hypothetical protein